MRYARINDGYRLATSALTTLRATPDANRCSAAPLCDVPSPGWCAGSASPARRYARTSSGSMTPVAAPASASRSYRRGAIRARANAAPPSKPRDLLDIRGGISSHALRVAAVDLVNLIAPDVFAIRSGDSKVPRHRLEPVPGQISRREVIAQHSVECVNQLAAGRDEAHSTTCVLIDRASAPRRPLS